MHPKPQSVTLPLAHVNIQAIDLFPTEFIVKARSPHLSVEPDRQLTGRQLFQRITDHFRADAVSLVGRKNHELAQHCFRPSASHPSSQGCVGTRTGMFLSSHMFLMLFIQAAEIQLPEIGIDSIRQSPIIRLTTFSLSVLGLVLFIAFDTDDCN